ncbi:hypothetical protein RFI_34995 [Reticulomyxa filosa]|uniref:Uncharacterized protein n=1 Tax=Reticulomyxa filosa TaxID=46433 RepID=X6LM67_RETFI|nr:hypothetical protein RFI_34995 [Reticulomyxa filosa]|eukprot:ETO02436.1 hypothetical protein RFI_34995 [Reticulomyxa filosa]
MFAYLQDTENYPCVCVANTHTHWWELYSKIATVVLSPETPQLEFLHKIVFVVMLEQNTKAMAQRCAHDVLKFKIETMTHQIFPEMLQNGKCMDTMQQSKKGRHSKKSIRKKQLSSVFGRVWRASLFGKKCNSKWSSSSSSSSGGNNVKWEDWRSDPSVPVQLTIKGLFSHSYSQILQLQLLNSPSSDSGNQWLVDIFNRFDGHFGYEKICGLLITKRKAVAMNRNSFFFFCVIAQWKRFNKQKKNLDLFKFNFMNS